MGRLKNVVYALLLLTVLSYGPSHALADIIIDNGAAGTSYTGTWQVSGGLAPFDPADSNATSLWSRNGATYTWQFASQPSGTYEVLMWWSGWSSRATSIDVGINHSAGTQHVNINQQNNAGSWYSLGEYFFNGSGKVTITAATGSTVSTCADAVRFRLISQSTPPTAYIDSISPSPAVAGQAVQFTGRGTDPDGTVSAYEWKSSIDGFLSDSAGFTTSKLSVGTHSISLRVQDDAGIWSNPMVQVLVVQSGSSTPTEIIIDNRDTQTSRTGTWGASSAGNPYGADSVWSRNGATFTWRFTAPKTGKYKVSMWWTDWPSRSTSIPVTINYSGGSSTVSINQHQSLTDWYDLGEYPFQAGAAYDIKITSQPSPTSTCADAVKFIYSGEIGQPTPTRVVIDNGDPGTSSTGSWSVSGSANPYGTNSLYSRNGATYSWTFSPTVSGNYPVFIYWTYADSRSTSVPVDIEHSGGTSRINVNQHQVLNDWYKLGEYSFQAGVTYKLTITAQPSPTSTCADAVAFGSPDPVPGETEEQIFACMGFFYANPKVSLLAMLRSIGAQQEGDNLWRYQNPTTQKKYVIRIVDDVEGMKQALRTEKSHVIFSGHSNYGLGPVFGTPEEISAGIIDDILYIDDDRILNVSSPWIHVGLSGMRTSQAYPNWRWIFKDGTYGVMPYVFGDPQGDPAYNYYLYYQIPKDPHYYNIQTSRNGAIERFPRSGHPAWNFAVSNGVPPDPTNPADQAYYITGTAPWYPSFETFGAWAGSKAAPGYYLENYLVTPADRSGDRVEWTLRIPQAGTYKIYARWSASAEWSNNAPYAITHSAGTTTVLKDQRVNGGLWNKIGEFYFDAGEYPVVLSDNADGGSVVADALRFKSMDDTIDVIIDNVDYPPGHIGSKTILFRKDLDIPKEEMKYSRLFYSACSSGIYYLGTFNRGIVFYTLATADAHVYNYLKAYLEGKSDEQIWQTLQSYDPIFDYYDFNKLPSEQ